MLFLHLTEITRFHIFVLMAYLQTRRFQGKIYSHVKNNLVYTQFVDSTVKGTLM